MYRFGLAVALVALLAAGCSDEKAGGLPPITSPSSTAPSPTATATATKAAATPAAQIEAAARAYYAELTRAGETGDAATLRRMIDPDCECAKTIDYLAEEARKGHRFTTKYRVDGVSTHDVTATAGFATVTLTYAKSAIVDRSGKVVRSLPGQTKVGRDLGFTREGERWVLTQLVLLGG
jgi:predicted lipid-binding transport protein (Tim44 family)